MKKKITRPISILLTLLLLIGTFTALPFTATAAETTDEEVGASYDLWLGETQVTDANKDDIYGDGRAQYDPSTKTLTLKDAYINGFAYPFVYDEKVKIVSKDDLTIEGQYSQPRDEIPYIGIYCYKSLTLKGDFVFRGKSTGIMAFEGINFAAGSIEIYCGTPSYSGYYAVDNEGENSAITFGKQLIKLIAETGREDGRAINNNGTFELADGLKITEPAGAGIQEADEPTRVVIEPTLLYDLWVGGTHVSSASKDDICADGEGRAKYDPSTKTLTLNDPVIDGYYKYYDSFLAKFYSEDDLTIVGKYSQPDDVPSYTYGIDCRGKLTLKGDFIFRSTANGILGAGIDFVSGEIGIYSVSSAVVNRSEEQAITFGSKLTKITAECTYGNSEAFNNSRGNFVFEEGMRISEPAGAGIYPNSNGSGQRIALSANASLAEKRVVIEPTYYNLWVGDTQVTSSNASDIFDNGGRVRFDANTNTLKLMNNPTINGTHTSPSSSDTYLIYWGSDENLRIEGSLYMNSAVSKYGIYAKSGSLDLAGNFTIRATNTPIYAKGDITFSSGTIKAISDGDYGIMSGSGNIEVKNDVVKLYSKANTLALLFRGCTLGNKMQITTPEGGRIKTGSGNNYILDSNGNVAKEVVIEPEFESLGVTSVIVAGNGNKTFLNGADWDPCDTSNAMSQVAVNVWEKTYTDVSASSDYWIKFAVNSVDEDGEASQDPWKYNFGSLSEAEYQTSVMYNAMFDGERLGFRVLYNHATVRIRLDLSEFNMNTKEGAKLLVIVTESEEMNVYFTDTQNFGDVYIEYSCDGVGMSFPKLMEVDSEKSYEAGETVYTASIPVCTNNISFINSEYLEVDSKWTVGITEDIADGAWWYALPETNEYGEYYVALVGSETQDEYTIAGSSEAIFGTQWDISNPLNDMIYDADNNCYFLKYSNVEPEFDVQLKVVKNHDWSNNWPEVNYTFDVISKTTVTVRFYPDTGEITVTGKGVSQITELDVKSVIVAGNGEDDYLNGANWDPKDTRNQMTEVADGIWEYTTARLPEFDNYQFKFAINSIGEDGSPTTNPWAYNFGFDEEKVYDPFIIYNAKFNGANGIFEVDEEGSTVTLQLDLRNFDYATKKGAKVRIDINRPEKYDVKLGNVEVTELNKDNILGDGKASYNPNTKTLYLMDPAIDVSGGDCNAITVFNDDIKIVGSYHMTEAAGLYGVEIEGKAGSLTLIGNFTFLGTDGGIRVAQDVNIDGGKLVVRSADGTGIFSDFGSINVGADVESVDVEGTDYAMLTIWSDSNINIDSDLTITTPEGGTVGTFDEDSCTIFDGTTPATHVVIAGEVEDTAITEISITNVTLPVGGQIPTNTAVGETGYDINMVNWYDAETDELVTGEFEADHQYYVKIVLWAQEGYVFDNPLAKINGEYAGVFAVDDMDEEKYIFVSQFYIAQSSGTVDPDTEITSVALTNVTVPKAGEEWDFTATVPESCELLETVLFDSEGTQINNYDFVPLTAQTYTAEFVLLAKDGYVFGYEDGTMPKFTATVNGEKATALVAFEEFPDDKMCRVRWNFTVEEGGVEPPEDELVDPETGITVLTEEDVELVVADITELSENLGIVVQGATVEKVYNITLVKDGQEVQPGSPVIVKIPCNDPNAKVYRVEADGSLTDMNAVYQDGYLLFATEHFSNYVVAVPEGSDVVIGDVNNDGFIDVQDATLIQKYAVKKVELTAEQLYAADVNNDGFVDVADATDIQKYAVKKITEFKKKA